MPTIDTTELTELLSTVQSITNTINVFPTDINQPILNREELISASNAGGVFDINAINDYGDEAHNEDEQDVENDDLDEYTQEEAQEHSAIEPVYPISLSSSTIYIYPLDIEKGFKVRFRGNTEYYESLYDVLNFVRRAVNVAGSHSMDIYPYNGSPQWLWLIDDANNKIVEQSEAAVGGTNIMPERTRAPDGERIIRVKYNANNRNYVVCVPWDNPHEYNNTVYSSIVDAYHSAFEYAGVFSRGGPRWAVKPRRNSNEYADLVNRINWEVSPSPVDTYEQEQNALIESIRPNPVATEHEHAIAMFLKKHTWDFSENISAVEEMKLAIINAIQAILGEMYLAVYGSKYGVVHSRNAVVIDVGADYRAEGYHTRIFNLNAEQVYNMTSVCGTCSTRGLNERMRRTENSRTRYCNACYEAAGFYNCALCREQHTATSGCRRYDSMADNTILAYNIDVRRVIPKMYNMAKDKPVNGNYLRYGVELEVIANYVAGVDNHINFAAGKVGAAIKNYAILKSDSSLVSGGFEIVSVPATLEYHRRVMWNKLFGTDEKGNRNIGEGTKAPAQYVKSWDTNECGIHIHITRAAMTPMQLSKLCVFYHEPGNNQFLSRIAGRNVNDKARYFKAQKKRLGTGTVGDCSNDHHDAIVISQRNGGKTAEVRIFRGNASRHGLLRCLEFVDATVHWCAQNGAKELLYTDFLQWFKKNNQHSVYPDLWKYLIQLGYLTTKHTSKGKDKLDAVPEEHRCA